MAADVKTKCIPRGGHPSTAVEGLFKYIVFAQTYSNTRIRLYTGTLKAVNIAEVMTLTIATRPDLAITISLSLFGYVYTFDFSYKVGLGDWEWERLKLSPFVFVQLMTSVLPVTLKLKLPRGKNIIYF